MNMQATQINPIANAAKDMSAKGRVAESGDGEASFRDVLKGEVAERKQAEAAAGKADKTAPKAQDSAASESVNAVQEKDESEQAVASTSSENMTQLLVLASQFVQPVANTEANATTAGEAAAATDAAGAQSDVTAIANPDVAAGAKDSVELAAAIGMTVQQAPVTPAQRQVGMEVPIDSQAAAEKPDFAGDFDLARMSQQSVANASPDKGMQQAGTAAEALAAAQTSDTASELQQPATAFVALQQAAVEAETLVDPSANRIAPRIATPAWNQAVGQKIVWMAGNAQQSASLTLNPPDLGPLQVVIRVSESMATANFVSAHPEVRQALEAAMPRLREMLGEAGIQLGQAHVGAGTSGEYGARTQQQLAQPAFGSIETSFSLQQDLPQSVQVIRRGLVDTFA